MKSLFSIAATLTLGLGLCVYSNAALASGAAGKCLPKFNEISKIGHHWKAFAGNTPNANGQACGWVEGFPSKSAAVAKAMSECKVSEKGHPTWGVTGTCHLLLIK